MGDRIQGVSGVIPFVFVPQAPLNFPNSARLVEPINEVLTKALFSVVTSMTNDDGIALSNSGQRLQGNDELYIFWFVATQWDDGNSVSFQKGFARFWRFYKTRLQADAMVRQEAKGSGNFGLEVELVQMLNLVTVPCIKLFVVTCAHAIRIVELLPLG